MKTKYILATVLLILATVIAVPVFAWWSAKVEVAERSNQLEASYKTLATTYTRVANSVLEAAQVSKDYTDSYIAVLKAANTSKFGPSGSQAAMQWFSEKGIELTPQMHIKIQQLIESGNIDIARDTKIMTDQQQAFQNRIDYPWSGFWINLVGGPKFPLSKYDPVVNADVREKMETKVGAPLNVFNKPQAAQEAPAQSTPQ